MKNSLALGLTENKLSENVTFLLNFGLGVPKLS